MCTSSIVHTHVVGRVAVPVPMKPSPQPGPLRPHVHPNASAASLAAIIAASSWAGVLAASAGAANEGTAAGMSVASAESALDSATFASNASALLRRFLYDCPNLAGLSGSLHRTALSGSLHPFPPHTFLGRPLLSTYRAGLVKSTAGESGISLFALRDARPAIPLRILQVGRRPRDA